jgi:hypothetical protein
VKLTGPNRSIGLIQPTHPAQRQGAQGKPTPNGQDRAQKTEIRSQKPENRRHLISDF